MIREYDRVKVKSTGDTGIVVDIRNTNGTYFWWKEIAITS